MSACFTLHRALRGAFKLRNQVSRPALIRVQPMCIAITDQKQHVIEETTDEYSFVERLIPPTRVPLPPRHDGPAPSGWVPPSAEPPSLPYMIRRSRMHNIPVYTDISHGNRKTTLVRKVEGDIWALDRDVKEYLKGVTGVERATQVNEVNMSIRIKGHFDKEVKEWLIQKGF